MPHQTNWDRYSIKAAIERKGFTLIALDLKGKLPKGSCQIALTRCFPKADKVVAKFLGEPLHILWPSRYDESGKRLYSHSRYYRNRTDAASQKSRASAGTAAAA